MIGRAQLQDQPVPPKDSQERFGMVARLGSAMRFPFTREPQYLKASNKPSEHNIGKMPRFIPVAQLANARRGNVTIANLMSSRIHVRPGSQTLGRT